jgi:hypothetical protein
MKTMSKIIQVASVVTMLFASSLGYAGGPGAYAPPGSPGVGGPGAGGAGAGGNGGGGNGGGDIPAESPTEEIDDDVTPCPVITPTESADDVTTFSCTTDGYTKTCKVEYNQAGMEQFAAENSCGGSSVSAASSWSFSFTTPGTGGADPLLMLGQYLRDLVVLEQKIDEKCSVDGRRCASVLAGIEEMLLDPLPAQSPLSLEDIARLRSDVNSIADALVGSVVPPAAGQTGKGDMDALKRQVVNIKVMTNTYLDQLPSFSLMTVIPRRIG